MSHVSSKFIVGVAISLLIEESLWENRKHTLLNKISLAADKPTGATQKYFLSNPTEFPEINANQVPKEIASITNILPDIPHEQSQQAPWKLFIKFFTFR